MITVPRLAAEASPVTSAPAKWNTEFCGDEFSWPHLLFLKHSLYSDGMLRNRSIVLLSLLLVSAACGGGGGARLPASAFPLAAHEASEDVAACLEGNAEACMIAGRRLARESRLTHSPVFPDMYTKVSLNAPHVDYPNSTLHTNSDWVMGLQMLEKACELGDADGCFMVAVIIRLGYYKGSKRALAKRMVELALPACQADHVGACREAYHGARILKRADLMAEIDIRACDLGFDDYCDGKKPSNPRTPIDRDWKTDEHAKKVVAKPAAKPSAKDISLAPKHLIGKWAGRSQQTNVKYHFCANGRFAILNDDALAVQGRFKIDEAASPAHLDLIPDEDAPTVQAIIDRIDSVLRIKRSTDPGVRPTEWVGDWTAVIRSGPTPQHCAPSAPVPSTPSVSVPTGSLLR